jgi:hypothetical protein
MSKPIHLTATNTRIIRRPTRSERAFQLELDAEERRRKQLYERCPLTIQLLEEVEAAIWGSGRIPGSPHERDLLLDIIKLSAALDTGLELEIETRGLIRARLQEELAWRADPDRKLVR